MIITIIVLFLSVIEATAVSCTNNVSIVTLELRDEIADSLNEGINASGMQELRCAEVGSK